LIKNFSNGFVYGITIYYFGCEMEKSADSLAITILPIIQQHRLKDLPVICCIDNSGSTGEQFSCSISTLVLDVEKNLITQFIRGLSATISLMLWNSYSKIIESVRQIDNPAGGTNPSCIFETKETLALIGDSKVAVIMTDGKIEADSILSFGKGMAACGKHLKAIIGIIVGDKSGITPSAVNISVLLPAMISNACILFYDGTNIYVVWTSGIFKTIWNPHDITEVSTWPQVTQISIESIHKLLVPFYNERNETRLLETGYIPFGESFFNPTMLLLSNPVWEEFEKLPFDRICQYFKVMGKCQELLDWFTSQKDKFLKDFIGENEQADNINELINTLRKRSKNITNSDKPLISSYIKTRNYSLVRRYLGDSEIQEIANLTHDPRIIQLVTFFGNMMRTIEEDNRTQYNGSSYTASSLSSTRYVFGKIKTSVDKASYTNTKCTHITADFTKPYKWYCQFKSLYPLHGSCTDSCSICFEQCSPFILIRKPFPMQSKELIQYFHNHPLDYIYPEIVCCKCADYFCLRKQDPVRVNCIAAIPIVKLTTNSEKNYYVCFSKLTELPAKQDEPISSTSMLAWIYNMSMKKVTGHNNSQEPIGPKQGLAEFISAMKKVSQFGESISMVKALSQF